MKRLNGSSVLTRGGMRYALAKGKTMTKLSRDLGASIEEIRAIQKGRLLIQAKLGELLPHGGSGGRGKKKPDNHVVGFSSTTVALYRKVAKWREQIDDYCRALKDGRKDYTKAFEIATAMVENYWQLGNELRRMSEAGLLSAGKPKGNADKSQDIKLSDLGVSEKLSSRTQKLAEQTKAELHEGIEKAFDDQTCKLPTLCGDSLQGAGKFPPAVRLRRQSARRSKAHGAVRNATAVCNAIESCRRRQELSFSIHQEVANRGKHEEACEQFGIAYSTAKHAAVVCNAVERCRRRHELPFSHHQEVANRSDADELQAALATVAGTDEAIKLLRAGDGYMQLIKDYGADTLAVNAIQRGRLYVQAKLGELIPNGGRGGRGKKKPVTQGNQFSKKSAARFRKVSKAEDKIDAYCRSATGDGEPVEMSTAGFINYLTDGARTKKDRQRAATRKRRRKAIVVSHRYDPPDSFRTIAKPCGFAPMRQFKIAN